MERYLTPKEVQQVLGLSRTKTYEMINQKDFPKVRLGKNIWVPASELERFMKKSLFKTYEII